MSIRSDSVDWLEVDGEIVILDAKKSIYMSLNPSAAGLWKLLAAGATKDDLVESLIETYGIDRELALQDVDRFVGVLASHELLAASA